MQTQANKTAAPEASHPNPNRTQVRSVRRTLKGNFTKAAFDAIGGKQCKRFYSMTWKERDAFMAKPENKEVHDRYLAHLQNTEQSQAA